MYNSFFVPYPPELTGNTLFFESVGYLNSIGLEKFIKDMVSGGKITFKRY